MSLSIRGSGADGMLRALQGTSRRLERDTSHLATGKRIASAADDAAGLAIAVRLQVAVGSMAQGEANLAGGQDLARVAEGALQGSQDAIARMRELGVQAQNGTLSSADRATLQQEYDGLAAQLDQTAGGTRFAGRNLLDGSSGGTDAIVVGDGDSTSTLDLPDVGSSALGLAGLDLSDPATLQRLDAATDRLSSVRSSIGSFDASLSRRSEALANARENAEAARSRIEDADVAQEVASLTRDRILQGMQMLGLAAHGSTQRAALDVLG